MASRAIKAASKAAARGFLQRLKAGWTIIFSPGALEQAREQARLAEHRLREAIDALPEGIVFLDAQGRYVLWNARYAEMYARSADLFRVGVRLEDTLRVGVARGDYPQAVGREEAWLAERLALLKNPGVRHEQRLANGRWIMIEERLTQDGGAIGLRVDITDMKAQAERLERALEAAEAANRAKSDFLANMSHEIRTPLNGVIGLADVLSRTKLDEDQRDLLRTLVASAGDLNNLLSDLLDFSKLEAGKLTLEETRFDLGALVNDAAALFRPGAEAKGLSLSVAIEGGETGWVQGDPARMKQILVNLLSNAVKFTDQGRVALTLHRSEARGWTITVADTGVGFPADAAERLFDRFEQADASTTRQFGGTGLGLSICRQLAEAMGGTITAQGRPGEGATFTVSLPLKSVDEPMTAAGDGEYPPIRVLLADDNATNRKVVELMLTSVGAETTACENGEEAVDAFRRDVFDLVLMDLQMPVMDGLSATRAIREIELAEGRSRTPLVVLSANVSPEHRRASALAGAEAHLGKPIRADELISTLMAVLQTAVEAVEAA